MILFCIHCLFPDLLLTKVYDRVSTFLDSLWRSFDTNNSRNYVLVTHGIAIRVILTRYFRYSIDQFHLLANPVRRLLILIKAILGDMSLTIIHPCIHLIGTNTAQL